MTQELERKAWKISLPRKSQMEAEERPGGRWDRIALPIALVVGLMLLLSPSLSDYWNSVHQSRAIMSYAEQISKMDAKQYAEMIGAAEQYNEKLSETGINWTMNEEQQKEYQSILNYDGKGVMGYIDVPKINVKLPIYHGTSDEVLKTSIGHLPETSLPVGGEGSHSVLSGHRGLPSAKLFSDLDKLVEGDTFTLAILNETYTYEVDKIRVVEPKDLSELRIIDKNDYCTLVTCTPYGINTHRLLVRGYRIDNIHGNAEVIDDALLLEPAFVAPFIMTPLILFLLAVMFLKPSR